MLTRFTYPVDDSVFFVPFSSYQATDPIALSDMRQCIYDLSFGCAAAIEECPFGLCKRLPARLALVSLPTGFGLPKLYDLALPFAFT